MFDFLGYPVREKSTTNQVSYRPGVISRGITKNAIASTVRQFNQACYEICGEQK